MPDGVFNIAKGRVAEFHTRVNDSDPTNAVLLVMLLQDTATQTDAQLEDHATFSAILAAANDEANFTNYETSPRRTLTDADVGPITVDTGNNWVQVDITTDITYAAAGGGTDNTMTKVIIGYVPDSTSYNDTNVIPLTHHDFSPTTNGNDLVIQIDADGYYRAV